jgi:hypothetical protein
MAGKVFFEDQILLDSEHNCFGSEPFASLIGISNMLMSLVSSSLVLCECHNGFLRSWGRRSLLKLRARGQGPDDLVCTFIRTNAKGFGHYSRWRHQCQMSFWKSQVFSTGSRYYIVQVPCKRCSHRCSGLLNLLL